MSYQPASTDTATRPAHQASPWTRHENTFSAEISDLEAAGYFQDGGTTYFVTGPTGRVLPFATTFKAQRDSENELTHWEYKVEGFTYLIFND